MPLTMLLGALVLLRRSLRDLDAIVPKLRDVGSGRDPAPSAPARVKVA